MTTAPAARPAPATGRTALALVALGTAALAWTRGAQAVDPAASGLAGSLLVRVDVGAALVVGVGAWWSVHRRRDEAPAARRAGAVRDLLGLWGLWIATIALAAVTVHHVSLPDALATAAGFRAHDTARLGLGVGRVVLALALGVAVGPLVAACADRRRVVAGLLGGLAAVGVASRVAEGALDPGVARGVVSLGAHAEHIAWGAALALLAPRVVRSRPVVGVAAALVAAGLVVAAVAVDPLPRGGAGAHDLGLVRGLAAALVAAGLVTAGAAVTARGLHLSRAAWAERSLAVAAPGLLLVHEQAFVLVARRYPERLREGADGLWLAANATPPVVWSLVVGAAAGVLGTWAVVAYGRRRDLRTLVGAPLTIAAVTAFGYVVRLVTLLDVAPARTDSGDPRAYHVGANLLAHARGVPEALNWLNDETIRPTALHGPLYQLLLSISSRFGGTAYIDHKLVSLLIGAGVVLAAVLLAREIAGPGVALVAGLLAAVYPNLWILDGIMFPEPLAALLTTLAVLFAYRWRAAPSYRATVVLGVVIALGALARGEGLLLLPLVVAPCMLLATQLAWSTRVRHLVVAGLAFGLVISPWTLRNLRTFENFVPLSTNSNELLAYSNCDTTYFGPYVGHWDFNCQERIRQEQGEFPGDESQTSAAWRNVAVDYARAHKAELPRVAAVRVLRQWELYGAVQNIGFGATEGRNRTAAGAALAMYYPLVLLAAVGLAARWRNGRWNLPLLAPFAGVTFVALYAYGNTRFRAPAEPALCVLAAIGIAALVARRRGGPAGASTAVAGARPTAG
jgi:hypothetical protein